MGTTFKPVGVATPMVTYTINQATSVYGRDAAAADTALFGNANGGYNSLDAWYWYSNAYFVDITIDANCNIWAIGCTDYPTYYDILDMEKWNGSSWDAYGSTIDVGNDGTVWNKIYNQLPAGRYRFRAQNSNLSNHGEWYLEPAVAAPELSGLSCSSPVHGEDSTLSGDITDNGTIQYRVSVNGSYVYPDGVGSYTTLASSPVTVNYLISNAYLNVGNNTVLVEALDDEANPSSQEFTVVKNNNNPTDTLVTDRVSIHSEDVVVSGNISDSDGDDVKYRILVDGSPILNWTALAPSPVAVNYTVTNGTFGGQSRTITVEYEDAFGGTGSFVQAITFTNDNPVISVTQNYLGLYDAAFVLSGSITESEGDNVRYRVVINAVEYQAWTSYLPSPVSINISIPHDELDVGDNTVTLYVEDNLGGTANQAYNVKRRDWRIVHVDSANATTNYIDTTSVLLSDTKIVLVDTGSYNSSLGYPDVVELVLNMLVQGTGNVKVAKILDAWTAETVTYNTIPTLDTSNVQDVSFLNTATQTIDTTLLANVNGVALYTLGDSFQLDYLGHNNQITYKETALYEPPIVYFDTAAIKWGPPVLDNVTVKNSAFYRLVLQRAEQSDFSDASTLFQTTDMSIKSFQDDTIALDKTYYYRLLMQFTSALDDGTKWDFAVEDDGLYIEEDGAKIVFNAGSVELSAGTTGSYYLTSDDSININTIDWNDITAVTITQTVHDFIQEDENIEFNTADVGNYVLEDNLKINLVADKASLVDDSGYPVDQGYTVTTPSISMVRSGILGVTATDNSSSIASVVVSGNVVAQGTLTGGSKLWATLDLDDYMQSIATV